jgi:hypothetical protein
MCVLDASADSSGPSLMILEPQECVLDASADSSGPCSSSLLFDGKYSENKKDQTVVAACCDSIQTRRANACEKNQSITLECASHHCLIL